MTSTQVLRFDNRKYGLLMFFEEFQVHLGVNFLSLGLITALYEWVCSKSLTELSPKLPAVGNTAPETCPWCPRGAERPGEVSRGAGVLWGKRFVLFGVAGGWCSCSQQCFQALDVVLLLEMIFWAAT